MTDVDVIRQALEALCLDSLEVPVAKVLAIPVAERGHVDVLIIAISEGLDRLAARVHSLEAENAAWNDDAAITAGVAATRRMLMLRVGGQKEHAEAFRVAARAVVLEGAQGKEDLGGLASKPQGTEQDSVARAAWVDGPLGHLESDS